VATQSAEAIIRGWKALHTGLRKEYQNQPTRAKRRELEQAMGRMIQEVNHHVVTSALQAEGRRGAYTTLDVVALLGDQALVAHVGDGRVYLIRGGRWYQLTRDHTRAEEMRQSGQWKEEQLKKSPFRQELTRAIGVSEAILADLFCVPLHAGDVILMCSNGLSDLFWDSELKLKAQSFKKEHLSQQCIDFAIQNHASDNVTVQTIFIPTADQLRAQVQAGQSTVSVQVAERILINPDVAAAMQKVTVFQGLKENSRGLMNLLGQTTVKKYAPGETLLVQGAPSDSLLVILDGEVEVLEFGNVVATRKKGEVIGEIGFFTNVPRTASVIARTTTQVLLLKKENFEHLLNRDARLGIDLAKGVIQELGRKLLDKKAIFR
jgi:serine/threonine protein phosphatase PrpC